VPPSEPDPRHAAERAPAVTYGEGSAQWQARQEPARPRFWLVRHADPTASLAVGQPRLVAGTWIVPSDAVDDLTSHGFTLISFLPSTAEAEPASD
jgi:hypothetical protein